MRALSLSRPGAALSLPAAALSLFGAATYGCSAEVLPSCPSPQLQLEDRCVQVCENSDRQLCELDGTPIRFGPEAPEVSTSASTGSGGPPPCEGCSTRAKEVAAGFNHTCALMADKSVRCWGDNTFGQLGGSSVVAAIEGLSDVEQLVASGNGTCARTGDGRLFCWGANGAKQLGLVGGPFMVPTELLGLPPVEHVSMTFDAMCVIVTEPQGRMIRCWGDSAYARIINLSRDLSLEGQTSLTRSTIGGSAICALTDAGRMVCWGCGGHWELAGALFGATGFANQKEFVPYQVDPAKAPPELLNEPFVDAHSVWGTTFIITKSKQLWVSGGFMWYGLGLGPGPSMLPPGCEWPRCGNSGGAKKVAVDNVVEVAAAHGSAYERLWSVHACARTATGEVYCWGHNEVGQIGRPIVPDHLGQVADGTPAKIDGLSGVIDIAVGEAHTCAVTEQGDVRCWGFNAAGQLGNSNAPTGPEIVNVSFK